MGGEELAPLQWCDSKCLTTSFRREKNIYIICISIHVLFCFLINFFVDLLAALGSRCWVQAFSSYGEQGLLFIAVRGLLIAVASLVAEHGL